MKQTIHKLLDAIGLTANVAIFMLRGALMAFIIAVLCNSWRFFGV